MFVAQVFREEAFIAIIKISHLYLITYNMHSLSKRILPLLSFKPAFASSFASTRRHFGYREQPKGDDSRVHFPNTTFVPKPGDGAIKSVTLVPGEGIGPQLCDAVMTIFNTLQVPVTWDVLDRFSFDDPASIEALHKNKTIIKGPISNQRDRQSVNNMKFAKELDLYVFLSHCFTIPGIATRHGQFDVVIMREISEGEYSGLEHEIAEGVVESIKIITKEASLKIAQYAFDYAMLNHRKKVTAVHKANIMKLVDGQFLEATRQISEQNPTMMYQEIIVDNCSMQLVQSPSTFDVMVLPNLYGAIMANIMAGLIGSPGLIPGCNIGREYVLFEQGVRHAGIDIAGKNIANPTGLILASVMMLRNLNMPYFAERIQHGIFQTLYQGKVRTPDIGGTHTTTQYVDEILRNIEKYTQKT